MNPRDSRSFPSLSRIGSPVDRGGSYRQAIAGKDRAGYDQSAYDWNDFYSLIDVQRDQIAVQTMQDQANAPSGQIVVGQFEDTAVDAPDQYTATRYLGDDSTVPTMITAEGDGLYIVSVAASADADLSAYTVAVEYNNTGLSAYEAFNMTAPTGLSGGGPEMMMRGAAFGALDLGAPTSPDTAAPAKARGHQPTAPADISMNATHHAWNDPDPADSAVPNPPTYQAYFSTWVQDNSRRYGWTDATWTNAVHAVEPLVYYAYKEGLPMRLYINSGESFYSYDYQTFNDFMNALALTTHKVKHQVVGAFGAAELTDPGTNPANLGASLTMSTQGVISVGDIVTVPSDSRGDAEIITSITKPSRRFDTWTVNLIDSASKTMAELFDPAGGYTVAPFGFASWSPMAGAFDVNSDDFTTWEGYGVNTFVDIGNFSPDSSGEAGQPPRRWGPPPPGGYADYYQGQLIEVIDDSASMKTIADDVAALQAAGMHFILPINQVEGLNQAANEAYTLSDATLCA